MSNIQDGRAVPVSQPNIVELLDTISGQIGFLEDHVGGISNRVMGDSPKESIRLEEGYGVTASLMNIRTRLQAISTDLIAVREQL